MTEVVAYIGLGGNLGDVVATFQRALELLAGPELRVIRAASLYRSRALTESGYVDTVPAYWNSACVVRTTLTPTDLMRRLIDCETKCGRERSQRWASRTLDLDLLLYGDRVIATPELSVPHPRLRERSFVLSPLLELDATLRLPPDGVTVAQLLANDERVGLLAAARPWPAQGAEQRRQDHKQEAR